MYQWPPNTNSSGNALAQLDTLAEARRMLTAKGETGQQGMSFEMLVRLVKEGKADQVEITPVPDELHVSYPRVVGGASLTLFVQCVRRKEHHPSL